MIASAWRDLEKSLAHGFMLTIFGYSAPSSDKEAVQIMKQAWGPATDRWIEQIEIIDIGTKEEVRKCWRHFIHTHHYDVHANFYDSWIAKHPRRTGEAYKNQYIEAKLVTENDVPRELGFPELWSWYARLVEHEVTDVA